MSKKHTGRSSSTKRVQRQREKLMLRDPHCWRCGRKVVYWFPHEDTLPDNFATIGHVYSWNIPKEERPKIGEWRLECYRCNNDQGRIEQQFRQLREKYGETKTSSRLQLNWRRKSRER